jgi:putative ABC transport system permease protein
MFRRLLWSLLKASRARLAVALVALAAGGAVISALGNLCLEAESKVTREFSSLGANVIVEAPRRPEAAGAGAAPQLLDEGVVQRVEGLGQGQGSALAASPYLFAVVRSGGREVVVAGTWLDEASIFEPWWKIEGESITSRDDANRCLVGRTAARLLNVRPGSALDLEYGAGSGGRKARLTVAGIVDAGGEEDSQVFANIGVVQKLAGLGGKIQMVQVTVTRSAKEVESWTERIAAAVPGVEVRPVRQIAEAEGALVVRIRFLIFSMMVLILVLTALCVLATMAALALERRNDVGLMKALGGSAKRVVSLFLAEAGILGSTGGAIGYVFGMVLLQWIGLRVFGTSFAPRLEVLPLTVALMTAVALAGAMPLRLLGRVRPAVILRGEE